MSNTQESDTEQQGETDVAGYSQAPAVTLGNSAHDTRVSVILVHCHTGGHLNVKCVHLP